MQFIFNTPSWFHIMRIHRFTDFILSLFFRLAEPKTMKQNEKKKFNPNVIEKAKKYYYIDSKFKAVFSSDHDVQ